jgi:adenosylcobinamide-GDP ribazoletransferase
MRGFFSALSFLTIIPIPDRLKGQNQNRMFPWYPAVGLVIGCLLSVLFWLVGKIFADALAVVTLVAGSLLLTGAIHLDGLADCSDGFYGKRTKEETLRILKDPRIGAMGGAAIGISLLARSAAFFSLGASTVLLALPVLTAFSRTTVLAALRFLPYARSEGGIISAAATAVSGRMLALAALVIVVVATLLPIPTIIALVALVAFWHMSWRRIGGCTGDVLGASIEIAEIIFLAALAALDHIGFAVGLFYPFLALIAPTI